MIQKIITELEQKLKVSWLDIFNDFKEGMTIRQYVSKYNISEHILRRYMAMLNLKFPQRDRQISIDEFEYRLGLEQGQDVNLVKQLEKDLSITSNENIKLHKSLVLQRDNNNALRKQVRELARDENIADILLEYFAKHLEEANFERDLVEYSIYPIEENTPKEGLCLVLSDEHFGEIVDPRVTPNNKYNYDVAEKRLDYVLRQVLAYPKQSKDITVFSLLDSIKGIIHGGVYTSEGGFTTSIIKLIEVMSRIYAVLGEVYDKVNVYVTLDNHSRKTEGIASKDKWDNFSVMAIKMIDMLLQAKGISNVSFVHTYHDYNECTINDANILIFHGDSVRSYKPHNPSEVAKVNDIGLDIFKKPFKHFINGHNHYSCVVDNQYGGKCIQNGTLVGNNEYGLSNGFRPITPSQTIFFVESDGNIEDVKIVNLAKVGLV